MGIKRPTEDQAFSRLERSKKKQRPAALGGASPVICGKVTLPEKRKSDR